ncbi:MAG: acyl-CoA thioesterase [Phycisphaeraceae bacterium]|nr:acyl-CoA thioesterase [Phycisphaeraceae bacterium]MCW5754010.1 acyl-CoA thioesterase [Phycisphaeraceae bacterium]
MTDAPFDAPGWPVVTPIAVAWGDMDAFGHVNNAVYFRWFETSRIAWLHYIGWNDLKDTHGAGVILHSVQARFRRPVRFPSTLAVGTRLASVEDDRFTLAHAAWCLHDRALVAEGSGIIVSYDYLRGRKTPIPAFLRAAMLRTAEFPSTGGPHAAIS